MKANVKLLMFVNDCTERGVALIHSYKGPEWPSGLVACSPRRRPGFASRSVGLSEINFSDLYCGWLGRNINVEYNTTHNTIQHNTIQYNTTQHNTTGARWCRGMFGALQLEGCGFESTSKPPRRDPGQVLHSQLLMRFGVKQLRLSVCAVVGSASEWEICEGRYNKCSNTIQYNTIQYAFIIFLPRGDILANVII